jgi:hypothetical protein
VFRSSVSSIPTVSFSMFVVRSSTHGSRFRMSHFYIQNHAPSEDYSRMSAAQKGPCTKWPRARWLDRRASPKHIWKVDIQLDR